MRQTKPLHTPLTKGLFRIVVLLLTSGVLPSSSLPAIARLDQAKKSQTVGRPSTKARRPAPSTAVAEAGAVSHSPLALPFKRAWFYADDITTLATTADEARIYLPLVAGRVVCLERETGARVWLSEPGGVICAPVAIGDKVVYIASRKLAEDGSEAGAALRAVDKITGLTLWAKDYPRAFTSPLTVTKERLYAGCADGALYALSSTDGEILWQAATQDVIYGGVLITENAIYFGSDDGALRGVEVDKGRELWKFQTAGHIRAAPVADDHDFYFGSSDGYFYAVNQVSGKVKWKSRAGAAIAAVPVIVGDKILVASFDNFIYALARSTGNKIWKRRLENRLTAAPLVEGDALMIAPIRGDHVAVFLLADGRRVNFYRLDKALEIVSAPVFTDNLLLLATDKGLLAARNEAPRSAPPTDKP
ncbi:MAG: PQQ-binding-like beta-propeller repeat protein [Acidobacteria bacterium]|nr:PQQ-binding-like beta-propeller repeat protein [Acidobacteriota bacterium]